MWFICPLRVAPDVLSGSLDMAIHIVEYTQLFCHYSNFSLCVLQIIKSQPQDEAKFCWYLNVSCWMFLWLSGWVTLGEILERYTIKRGFNAIPKFLQIISKVRHGWFLIYSESQVKFTFWSDEDVNHSKSWPLVSNFQNIST